MDLIGNVGGIISPILVGVSFEYFQSLTPAIMITAGVTLTCALLFRVHYRVEVDRRVVETYAGSRRVHAYSVNLSRQSSG